ncbi:transglycosylase SLT domain-containing protein [Achromobacter marplatensis]|uniref:transglycosylase SLT domain-containing protein n=1 Tax=Achromobacter marplatensis TaxID=470868 RepID=UPI003C72C21D
MHARTRYRATRGRGAAGATPAARHRAAARFAVSSRWVALAAAAFLAGCAAGSPAAGAADGAGDAAAGNAAGASAPGAVPVDAVPADAQAGTDVLGRAPVEQRVWTDRYDPQFRKYSKRFFGPGFDWRWFKAQGIAESGLQENAESWVGAKGIMQIMPATLREIAEKSELPVLDNDDPGANIAAGIFYDRTLYERWDDIPQTRERLAFTFASYNGGRSRILRAQDACNANCVLWAHVTGHAPEETRGYVARIMTLMGHDPP